MKYIYILLFFALLFIKSQAQQTVTFTSADGLVVTADHYVLSTQSPYIILLHQAGYSRGEYRETAPKFTNLGYNCLAVDLRSGNEVNFITNQTASEAKKLGLATNYIDAIPDIKAAIEFVASRTDKPIILLGSSYSASLALVEATHNFKIKAVISFSPGEYFDDSDFVKKSTEKLFVPVLALSSKREYSEMARMLDHLPKNFLTLFQPSQGDGVHGSRSLWDNNPSNQEYWMAIALFLNHHKLK